MDIDFSLVLVILVGVCGGLWLLDFLLIKRSRTEAVENYKRTQVSGKKKDEIDNTLVYCLFHPSFFR